MKNHKFHAALHFSVFVFSSLLAMKPGTGSESGVLALIFFAGANAFCFIFQLCLFAESISVARPTSEVSGESRKNSPSVSS